MSNNQDINKIIEEQDLESKHESLLKLQERLSNEGLDITEPNDVAIKKKNIWNQRNIIVFSFVFILLISGILIPLLLRTNPKEQIRYCTIEDYTIVDTDSTIQQYAIQTNKNILFFDWTDKADFCFGQQYILNSTNETICVSEETIDFEGVTININITDNKTELDFLENYTNICQLKETVNSVVVMWSKGMSVSYAKFEHNGYIYYFKVSDAPTENYILELINELLKVN